MTALHREALAASGNVERKHLDRLRVLGVDIGWLAQAFAYPYGVEHCETDRSGFYQPQRDTGKLHVILPVVEDGELIDLCAFRPDNPGGWALRTGAGFALGLDRGVGWHTWHSRGDLAASPPSYPVGRPPVLFSDPLDYLRGQGEGVAILDWESPDIQRLDVLTEVVASTPAVAELFRRALTRPPRLPAISIMENRNVA